MKISKIVLLATLSFSLSAFGVYAGKHDYTSEGNDEKPISFRTRARTAYENAQHYLENEVAVAKKRRASKRKRTSELSDEDSLEDICEIEKQFGPKSRKVKKIKEAFELAYRRGSPGAALKLSEYYESRGFMSSNIEDLWKAYEILHDFGPRVADSLDSFLEEYPLKSLKNSLQKTRAQKAAK